MAAVYGATQEFPAIERYGLSSQLRRATVSIVANLAEGQGRLTDGEFRQFLSQARGSLFEVEAELIAAKMLGLLSDENHARLQLLCDRTGQPLAGLIRYVRKQEQKRRQSRRRPPATNGPL